MPFFHDATDKLLMSQSKVNGDFSLYYTKREIACDELRSIITALEMSTSFIIHLLKTFNFMILPAFNYQDVLIMKFHIFLDRQITIL